MLRRTKKRLRVMTTDPTDPWKGIQPPERTSDVSALRIDPSVPWGMFWAVDMERNCLLILQHRKETQPPHRLPKLRGLQVETHSPDSGGGRMTCSLSDWWTGSNVKSSTGSALTSLLQPASGKPRKTPLLDFWHGPGGGTGYLWGGRDGRLSDEEQKGLVGELGVLDNLLFPVIGVSEAVRCWTGPLGAPKDFEIGWICIEAKARRGTTMSHVSVSSEHQLDSSGTGSLYLHVAEVVTASEDTPDAVTITEIAGGIRSKIACAGSGHRRSLRRALGCRRFRLG